MTDIFIESMGYEWNLFLDKMDMIVEEAKLELLDAMDPSPLFEAGSEGEEQSGGIFQAIVRLLKAIVKSIGDGFKKIGNWMTGAKVTPAGQNAKIQGMDPNTVVKLVNGDLADASDALRKASSGQMTIEEAKAFIDKRESVWNTLKSSALPVVGLAAFFIGKKFTVDSWRAQADAAIAQVEKENKADGMKGLDSKAAAKIAHLDGSQAKKDAAKQVSSQIVNYMQTTTRRGLGFLMGPLEDAFKKGYIERKLIQDAELMGTKEGRKKLKERDKQTLTATNQATKAVKVYGKNVDKASAEGNKALTKQMKAEDKLSAAKAQVFDNRQKTSWFK